MKIKTALEVIVKKFEEGDIPQSIAYAMHPSANVPMDKWSIFNRTVAFISGTGDARGFRQWKEAGRYVRKGSKAFPILAPSFKKVEDEEKGEDKMILRGFVPVLVFRMEDTDGEPLDYQQIELPELPFLDVAESWGIKVKAIPGHFRYLGYYSPRENEIALATSEEKVFFHELAHAADYRVRKLEPKVGQNVDREIVAELSACTLAYMVGKKLPDTLGNHFKYIKGYAAKEKMNVVTACMKYISTCEQVVNEIISAATVMNS